MADKVIRTRRLAAAIVLGVVALILLIGLTSNFTRPQAGEIGVVRNGGPLDNHNIRQVVPNGAGNTWTGWWSTTHYYPVDSQQRYFRFATCDGGACPGADALAITVPTSDGVDVTIEGTFYLNTVFDDSAQGAQSLKAFDTQFATRTFDGRHAYDGNAGWSAFLGAIVEPIVVNNSREVVSGVSCADLVSSCALVQNQGQAGTEQVQAKAKGNANQSNVARLQKAVEDGLAQDLETTLGRSYFKNIKFNLQRVILPQRVQGAIDEAQSAFAAVSQAQARVRSARLESQANAERQSGYRKCPTCARIDAIKALPRNLTALGSGFSIGVK
jgi:hypothetical protein